MVLFSTVNGEYNDNLSFRYSTMHRKTNEVFVLPLLTFNTRVILQCFSVIIGF